MHAASPVAPLVLRRLDPTALRALSAAVRAGRPVDLDLEAPAPTGVRLDEIAPLLRRARAALPADEAALLASLPPPARPLDPGEQRPTVTVLIPTHRRVPLGLPALLQQDLPVRVLVLANGPDGPRSAPGAEVITVPWAGHGQTRQRALSLVDSPYVLFTVDDAVPCGRGFLRTLVEGLEESGANAIVARQVPWPDADAVTRARLRRWTPPGRRVVPFSQCDHVATLYRTDTLRRFPLPAVPIAEDLWWSQGKRVVLAPHAPVVHSHPRRPAELYARNRAIHAERARMGLPPTVPSLGAVSAALPSLVRPLLHGGPAELGNHLAELLGQWRGAAVGRQQP